MVGSSPALRKLGRYEVIKHLASGGMAQVLLARATGVEGFVRHIVIKEIHVDRARDPDVIKMFIDEAQLAASLHHANIVQVHDIGQEDGAYYLAMEYLHGEDLRSLLTKLAERGDVMPLEHVLTIIMSAAAGLHHAHEQKGPDRKPLGLVHRDVSPANIVVCYDGTVKVVDFGIAKAAHRVTQTHSGTLKGKIAYMAPEQCMGLEVDRRSDVFALGIVLYELYTVRRLFKAETEFLTMNAIVGGKIPKPSLYRSDIPPALEEIIMKALAKEPTDRFQSADELRLALDRVASQLNLRTSSLALADYMTKFGRRPEPWLVDDDDEMEVLDIDFDGSKTGAVSPAEPRTKIPTPLPGSLLAVARDRHYARNGTWSDGGPGVASTTPMAFAVAPTTVAPAARPRRWRTRALVALPLVAVGIFVAMRSLREERPVSDQTIVDLPTVRSELTPAAEPSTLGSQTQAPIVDAQSPAPIVDAQSPAPTVEAQSPPTVEAQSPTVDAQSPTPTVEAQSPAPTVEAKSSHIESTKRSEAVPQQTLKQRTRKDSRKTAAKKPAAKPNSVQDDYDPDALFIKSPTP